MTTIGYPITVGDFLDMSVHQVQAIREQHLEAIRRDQANAGLVASVVRNTLVIIHSKQGSNPKMIEPMDWFGGLPSRDREPLSSEELFRKAKLYLGAPLSKQ